MICIINREFLFTEEDKQEILKQVKNINQLAKKMGYSRSYTTEVLNGTQKASAKFIYFLKQHIDISKLHYCEEEKPVISF